MTKRKKILKSFTTRIRPKYIRKVISYIIFTIAELIAGLVQYIFLRATETALPHGRVA